MRFRGILKKWLYGNCPGFTGSFPYCGTQVYFPKGSKIFELTCNQGIYELDNILLLEALVESNSICFDVGANIGLMALPILQHNKSCKVVSFEPSPNTLQFLNRTVTNSQFTHRWSVVDKALGSEVGELDFYLSSSALGAFDGFRDTQRVRVTEKITVPVTTLDIEWEAIGKPFVSVIKIDVEGAELDVLKGALSCIYNQQPSILLEWNATNLKAYNCQPEVLLDFAEKLEYQVFSVPDLLLIPNPTILKLKMLKTESFLMASRKTSRRLILPTP
ncbi:MAG: FkbM family methyltransferase [Oculatellaceae cyanobacterium bins.114]|nr:FkbM family methyltransferase [Oculatellaceae cyanobacterium bins.114]